MKAGGPGVRDCFLKDASRGRTCCAARWRARRKSTARTVERNDHRGGGAGPTGVVGKGKIAGVAKGWSGERNEYESN